MEKQVIQAGNTYQNKHSGEVLKVSSIGKNQSGVLCIFGYYSQSITKKGIGISIVYTSFIAAIDRGHWLLYAPSSKEETP